MKSYGMTLWVNRKFGDAIDYSRALAGVARSMRLQWAFDNSRRGKGNRAWRRVQAMRDAERGTVFNWPEDCV